MPGPTLTVLKPNPARKRRPWRQLGAWGCWRPAAGLLPSLGEIKVSNRYEALAPDEVAEAPAVPDVPMVNGAGANLHPPH